MNELKLSLAGAQLGMKSPVPLLQSLQVGQKLTATVVDKPSSGTLLLQVGAHQVSAKADVSVQIGTVLSLIVSRLGPMPSLRIVNPASPGSVDKIPLNSFLKLLVPAQGGIVAPLQTLLDPAKNANILSLLGISKEEIERIFKTLRQNQLPVHATALKSFVEKSGLFLESDLRLLLDASGLLRSGDLKAVLLSLLAKVRWALSRSTRQIGVAAGSDDLLALQAELEGALATITLKQLSALQAHDRGAGIWSFDLPVRLQNEVHSIQLSIEREDKASQQGLPSEDWKVQLNVTLPHLGPIEAELFMRGSKVSVVIYAEQAETADMVDGNLHRLKSGLESAGLSVSVLLCHQGHLGERSVGVEWSKFVDEKV
jgi:hypothetical protein